MRTEGKRINCPTKSFQIHLELQLSFNNVSAFARATAMSGVLSWLYDLFEDPPEPDTPFIKALKDDWTFGMIKLVTGVERQD